jgi:Putative mono-oxygenase ydhR
MLGIPPLLQREVDMHVSVFEYGITGMDAASWAASCEELAPAFAQVPGLVSKVWLKGADGRYGGVYVWEDESAYRAFLTSELGAALASHPHLEGLTMREWSVDERPTAVTRGILQAV